MILLAISYVLNIIDYFFTSMWVKLYGIDAEANPIGKWMLQNNFAPFIKIFLMAGLFLLLGFLIKRCPRAKYAIYIVFGCYSLVTIYHLTILFTLY